jgi:phage baseplate assembly protein W
VHRGTGSAVRSAGSRLHEITLVDDAIQSTVRAEVESAWARMIAAGWLAIDRVDVEASGDSVAVLVRYKNRLSGASRSLRIGAGQ